MARAMLEAEAAAAAVGATLTTLRAQLDHALKAYRHDVLERERLEGATRTAATSYLLPRAREREQRWAERLEQCKTDVAAAEQRQTAARLGADYLRSTFEATRSQPDAELGALLEERWRWIRSLDDPSARYSVATSGTVQPTDATAEELKAVRDVIQKDEWADLPAFYGTGDLAQRDCLHCGARVPKGKKRFCSRECQQMHLVAHGTPWQPKGRRQT